MCGCQHAGVQRRESLLNMCPSLSVSKSVRHSHRWSRAWKNFFTHILVMKHETSDMLTLLCDWVNACFCAEASVCTGQYSSSENECHSTPGRHVDMVNIGGKANDACSTPTACRSVNSTKMCLLNLKWLDLSHWWNVNRDKIVKVTLTNGTDSRWV